MGLRRSFQLWWFHKQMLLSHHLDALGPPSQNTQKKFSRLRKSKEYNFHFQYHLVSTKGQWEYQEPDKRVPPQMVRQSCLLGTLHRKLLRMQELSRNRCQMDS